MKNIQANAINERKIYFAGKVRPLRDWRSDIVPEKILYSDSYPIQQLRETRVILPNCTLHYTGPFLIKTQSHNYHETDHGKAQFGTRDEIQRSSFEGIDNADIVFAWIDDKTCYGTLVELGYAKAKDKIIWIAGIGWEGENITRVFSIDDRNINREIHIFDGESNDDALWFAYNLADELWIEESHDHELTPRIALEEFISTLHTFNSPIEEQFWKTWRKYVHSPERNRLRWAIRAMTLDPQYPIGRYRVDFAHPETKTVIELDGFASHSSTDDIANDRRRQREIEAMGWQVIRYGGKEIHQDVHKCVQEVYSIIYKKASVL